MSDLFAGYANYASTEAILEERLSASAGDAGPDSSVSLSLSVTLSVTYSWSWTW
ncbi:hypothetical protein OG948_31440 [Embleya sp. NBC_00888]|uniref:hypothetical protein n=1 Tax=Embleya sp. NBC_00888 TaxID=2975960 RepID=UPI00386766E3|nr:hypothetical protein OG948_31440 [Embleya sp. NBC_00888]